jgi:hypothetical protein
MQFSQVWKADPVAYEKALLAQQASMKRMVLWGGIGVVLALVFGKMLFSKEPKTA